LSFNFNSSSYLTFLFFNINYVDLLGFFLIGCSFIKSAQFGFHIWLPDSMEAPVPASSLIHSATLVSAGIYLLLRFSIILENSLFSIYTITVVGSFTAFYGGLVSMFQSDTKKILAYSTISHCGFLMVLLSTFNFNAVILYLYIHGFFKAAVFMNVGNINRLSKNNQDFKQMGSYYIYLPFECFFVFIGLMNLSGLPFTLGFYIKHLLLVGLNLNMFFYYFILINLIMGAFCGIFYSYRLFYNVFFDFKKGYKSLYNSYNRKILNSKYYTNSTFSLIFSVFGIFFISYFISFKLFNLFLSKNFLFSDFFSNFNLNFFYYYLVQNKGFLENFSYLNVFIIFFIISIIFVK
jgi:NADH:ubiquinone oxidoreductase subunit 5 (subunit L)/multisubunit Na+/H+ antiporter MnhA subunit